MGRKRRNKPKRRPVPWLPIVAVLLLGNVLLGLRFSPMTNLRVIRVEGAARNDQGYFEHLLMKESGKRALAIRPNDVLARCYQLSAVRTAEFRRNVFGRGLLMLQYRTPVAVIQGTTAMMDSTGAMFHTSQSASNLPTAVVPADSHQPGFALLRPFDWEGLAKVCVFVEKGWPNYRGTVVMDDNGSMCLNRGSDGRIDLGDSRSLDGKLSQLSGMLKTNSGIFQSPAVLNLVDPNHPAIRPLEPPKGGSAK